MKLEWIIDPPIILPDFVRFSMQSAADNCPVVEGIKVPVFATVRLCDDDTIKELNTRFRDIPQSTDVLSFPSIQYPHGQTAASCEEAIRKEYDDEADACFLGDIIISVPHIKAQSLEFRHSFEREAAYLLVHGICHLMGYDHMNAEEKEIMRLKEEKILMAAGLDRESHMTVSDESLLTLAQNAMKQSYSPYSHFPVGAALLAADGRVFTGCNVENASLGLTNCAERTAVFKAISEGAKQFDTIAIAANILAWPCGACRQVLNEFAPEIRILLISDDGQRAETYLPKLLPESFGPHELKKGERL